MLLARVNQRGIVSMHSDPGTLQESVERTYVCRAHLAFRTSVYLTDESPLPHVRTVAAYELEGVHPSGLCYAWNEPTADGAQCLVLQSADVRTPQEAVRGVLRGWTRSTPVRPVPREGPDDVPGNST